MSKFSICYPCNKWSCQIRQRTNSQTNVEQLVHCLFKINNGWMWSATGQSDKLVFILQNLNLYKNSLERSSWLIKFILTWTFCLVIIVQVISCRSINDTIPSIYFSPSPASNTAPPPSPFSCPCCMHHNLWGRNKRWLIGSNICCSQSIPVWHTSVGRNKVLLPFSSCTSPRSASAQREHTTEHLATEKLQRSTRKYMLVNTLF